MKKTAITAIIIDDEERARRVLEKLLLDYCEGVEVIAKCSNVPAAVLKINELNPTPTSPNPSTPH